MGLSFDVLIRLSTGPEGAYLSCPYSWLTTCSCSQMLISWLDWAHHRCCCQSCRKRSQVQIDSSYQRWNTICLWVRQAQLSFRGVGVSGTFEYPSPSWEKISSSSLGLHAASNAISYTYPCKSICERSERRSRWARPFSSPVSAIGTFFLTDSVKLFASWKAVWIDLAYWLLEAPYLWSFTLS